MPFQEILFKQTGQNATITLNRPSRLNAWTPTMEAELRSAVEAADADPSVRAIIITGAGRGFCAGADMGMLDAASKRPHDLKHPSSPDRATRDQSDEIPVSLGANYTKKFSYLLRTIKPIVAAINGPIAGIGLCMVLFCDFRFMADTAKLTTAFARRGLIAEHGMSWMLPRLIGTMNALDLLFSARTMDAAEAERFGLARALPADGFLDVVDARIAELVTLSSPRSIGVMKRQVYDSYFQSLAEACDRADEEMRNSFHSEDFKEGVAHFLEKRPPSFTGR